MDIVNDILSKINAGTGLDKAYDNYKLQLERLITDIKNIGIEFQSQFMYIGKKNSVPVPHLG